MTTNGFDVICTTLTVGQQWLLGERLDASCPTSKGLLQCDGVSNAFDEDADPLDKATVIDAVAPLTPQQREDVIGAYRDSHETHCPFARRRRTKRMASN